MSDQLPTNFTDKKGTSKKQKQKLFLQSFAENANVLLSARAAGVSRRMVYLWLEHDEDFFFAYNQAKEDAKDVLRAEIYRRGVAGWDEDVYQLGKYRGTVRKYSDTLLIFHSKAMMSEYREKQSLDVTSNLQAARDPALQSLTDEEIEILERASSRLTRQE